MAFLDENGLKDFLNLLCDKGDYEWYDDETGEWRAIKSHFAEYAERTERFDGSRDIQLTGAITGQTYWNGKNNLTLEVEFPSDSAATKPLSFLKNGAANTDNNSNDGGGVLNWLWVTGSDGKKDYVLVPKNTAGDKKYDAYLGDASTPFLGLYTGFVSATGVIQTTGGNITTTNNVLADGNIVAQGTNSIVQANKQVYSKGTLTADGNCNIGGITTITQRLVPAKTNNVNLGLSDARWLGIYSSSSVNVSSDLNVKTDLSEIDDRYIELFDLVQPYAYKFIDGTSGRYHTGFISQYVEEAMEKVGLKDTDLAFFCKDAMYEYVKDEDGNIIEQKPVLDEEGNQKYFYSLRYEEYIAIMTEKIKRMEKRINELEAKQEKLNTLEKEMVEIKSLLKSKNS